MEPSGIVRKTASGLLSKRESNLVSLSRSASSACLRAVTSWMMEKSVGRPSIVTGVEYTSTMRSSPLASRWGKVNRSCS